MKIIQQEFKITSKLAFIVFLALTTSIVYGCLNAEYKKPSDLILIMIMSIIVIPILIHVIWLASFTFEFKENQIVVYSLFTVRKRKNLPFKDLKKIEFVITPKGIIDTINFYFENRYYQKNDKISINSFQCDTGKIRLFLFAHIENMEELVEEKQKCWGDTRGSR